MITASTFGAWIRRIYNSDFDQAGNLFQMSTNFQVCFGDKTVQRDMEQQFRFYKARDLEGVPQSMWIYPIFKDSMNARIQATGIIGFIFVAVSTAYYELAIERFHTLNTSLFKVMMANNEVLFKSENTAEIAQLIGTSNDLLAANHDNMLTL